MSLGVCSNLVAAPRLDAPLWSAPPAAAAAVDEQVRSHVRALLSLLYPPGRGVERRRDVRYPFPFLLTLTPLGPQGHEPAGEDVVVAGKHLSERGLGFFHPGPLPHRRVLVRVSAPGRRALRCVLDVSWCRFMNQGWYESGGRFLEVLSDEPAAALPPE